MSKSETQTIVDYVIQRLTYGNWKYFDSHFDEKHTIDVLEDLKKINTEFKYRVVKTTTTTEVIEG